MSDKRSVAKEAHPTKADANEDAPLGQREDASLEDLWKEAVKRIEKENGVNISLLTKNDPGDLQQPEQRLQVASELFQKSRHPEERKTKVIQAVSGCLDWTFTGVSFFKEHVSGSYAVPAQLVAGSVLYMIQAAKDVSEDFDLIESTFTELHNALLDIGDLKSRKFRESNFLNKLMDIFVAMLDFCLFSGKMFTEYRRKRLYIHALLNGRNKKIMARCEKVKMTIMIFRATIPFQILDAVKGLDTKIEDIPANLLDLLQHEKIKPSDFQALWGKTTSLEKITKTLKDNKDLDPDIMEPIQIHMDFLKAHLVPGTFSWVEEEPSYKSWVSGHKTPVIYVSGTTGTGKTFFSYRCFQLLEEQARKNRIEGGKNNPRQTTILAYFPFEPGRQDSQSFRNVLAYILVQIAESDGRLGDSIAKDLVASKIAKEENYEKKINFMWEKLLVKKFEKTPDTSRIIYIILDGVELMEPMDRESMLRLFQTLNSDKDGIRILMTGPPDEDIYGPISKLTDCPRIDLFEKTRSSDDFTKLIEWHFNQSDSLKGFKDSTKDIIKNKLLDSPERVMSSVDLTLTMLEQCDGDASALRKIDSVKGQQGLYTAMIDTVCARRSPRDREIVEKIFALCTFAKEPFKLCELELLLEQEIKISNFDVAGEIEGRLSSLLYTDTYRSSYPSEVNNAPKLERDTETEEAVQAWQRLQKNKEKQVRFRQPAFKDYLEQSNNSMIRDPISAKVNIFLKLVGILCDQSSQGLWGREGLQEYAADWLLAHLEDVDVKKTTPQQGAQVVEALMRILQDQNDVSRIFEEIQSRKSELDDADYDIYSMSTSPEDPRGYKNLNLLLSWARKMSFHNEEKMSFNALQGIATLLKDPENALKFLADGHIMRWTEKMTFREAMISYNFICRALRMTKIYPKYELPTPSSVTVDATVARALIDYAKNEVYRNPVELARCRIAVALVLQSVSSDENRQLCLELYEANLAERTTLGPEKFYSYLGLAECYEGSFRSPMAGEVVEVDWEKVADFADKALIERNEEKGALGSELRNERCIKAFMLKSQALVRLGRDTEAIQTCEEALREDLEYTNDLVSFLNTIVEIHSKNREWTKVIQTVWWQRPKVRCEWLWHRSDSFTNKKDALRRAAVETRRIDFAIQVFEDAVEYWQTRDIGHSLATQFELAIVYRADARATKMAEIEIDRLIARLGEKRVSLWLVDRIFPELIDIHNENYAATEFREVKRQVITQIETLVQRYENMQIVEPLTIATALFVLAELWRKLGDEGKAKQYAERAFAACIVDLEDAIGSNDAAAFCLLAKVLMFANLEIDAKIALSLQFSFVNTAYDDSFSRTEGVIDMQKLSHPPKEDEDAFSSTHISPELPKEEFQEESGETGNDSIQVVAQPPPVETDDKNNSIPVQQQNADNSATVNGAAMNGAIDVVEVEDESDMKASEKLPSTAGNENGSNEPEIPQTEPSVSPSKENDHNGTATPPDVPSQPAEALADPSIYQDIIDDDEHRISCSGPCTTPEISSFGPNSDKMYYCLDCADVQYCEPCYQTQIRYYENLEEGFWYKSCWDRHRFITMPIDQWMGVKDGVIRIGKKEKLWKDWLLSVKSRWKRKMSEEEIPQYMK